jgi:hypothetical protein
VVHGGAACVVRAAWCCLALLGDVRWCLVVLVGAVRRFVLLGAAWRCSVMPGGAWWVVLVGDVRRFVLLGAAWRCLALLGAAWWCCAIGSCCVVVLGAA